MKDPMNNLVIQFVLGLAAAICFMYVYLLPSVLARHSPKKYWIGIVNLLLGWTIFGWIVALLWALKERKHVSVAVPRAEEIMPRLGRQVTGFVLFSIALVYFTGPLIALAGLFTFCDAWKSGIYKKKNVSSVLNISPMSWGVAMQGITVLAFPLYVINRNKLKTKESSNLFFGLTISFVILAFIVRVILLDLNYYHIFFKR